MASVEWNPVTLNTQLHAPTAAVRVGDNTVAYVCQVQARKTHGEECQNCVRRLACLLVTKLSDGTYREEVIVSHIVTDVHRECVGYVGGRLYILVPGPEESLYGKSTHESVGVVTLSLDTHVWTVYPPTQLPRKIYPRCSFSLGGCWYIVGPKACDSRDTVILKYNSFSQLWSQAPCNLIFDAFSILSCAVVGDTVYMLDSRHLLMLRFTEKSSGVECELPRDLGGVLSVFALGTHILINAGVSRYSRTPSPCFYAYSTVSGEWTAYEQERHERQSESCEWVGGSIGEGTALYLHTERDPMSHTTTGVLYCKAITATLPETEDVT
ncbi:hypothetical protein KIPB_010824 [Kipferlia bialata]|uniref:Kelch-type beta propeller n=1 Tax=Kipferlia bialata TaxID=797122 RepID=A0A391NQ55_9EUKA|nr:hypothetical protein KIPB_010824 [Kipferlia bialata]|eukprot:g10824.t1